MRYRHLRVILVLLISFSCLVLKAQDDAAKYDGAIYEEKNVPDYALPDVLETFGGRKIRSVKEWEQTRRPEILHFFEENIYLSF